jgi:hypothetical protein
MHKPIMRSGTCISHEQRRYILQEHPRSTSHSLGTATCHPQRKLLVCDTTQTPREVLSELAWHGDIPDGFSGDIPDGFSW